MHTLPKREIKFRFRLKLTIDQWGNYKKGDVDTFYINLLDEKSGLIRYPIDNRWEIVSCDQFTGLKDKNQKEIYEGDIVKYWGGIAPIVYDKYGFAIWNSDCDFFDINQPESIEVIGNIFENPELLDK